MKEPIISSKIKAAFLTESDGQSQFEESIDENSVEGL